MTRNNFKPDPKTLNKIQKYMHDDKSKFRERGNIMAMNTMFVFLNGEVIRVDSHNGSTHMIHKNLGLKCIKKLIDLQRYGIIRTGFMSDIFYMHSIEPPTKRLKSR